MAEENILVIPSHPLNKAFQSSDANTQSWNSLIVPLDHEPTANDFDGVIPMGIGGMKAPLRLYIIPYSTGQVGAQFSFRMFGWRFIGTDPNQVVWIPCLLAEFACVVADIPGPPEKQGFPQTRLVNSTYNFCDSITLVSGNLGSTGDVTSSPSGTNPSSLIGSALVEIDGVQKVQFDFQQTDPVAMNLLWARA